MIQFKVCFGLFRSNLIGEEFMIYSSSTSFSYFVSEQTGLVFNRKTSVVSAIV